MADSSNSPRKVEPRRWSALTMAGAAFGIAIAGQTQAAGPGGFDMQGTEKLWLAQSESGEAGEGGEGGEAGHAEDIDAAVEFLTDLGLIEGHLRAGIALYQAGLADQAITHMKHPQSEIYTELEVHLDQFGAPGFADELIALASAVEGGATVGDAETAFAAVLTKIEEARDHAHAGEAGEAASILGLVRVAAEEYHIGIVDGAVSNLHEYQDAWGFVQVARSVAEHMAGEDDAAEKAFGEKTLAALSELDIALPGVSPEGKPLGDAGMLLGAAAKIELAAYALK
ncbi:hypothetical protein QKW60_20125 [Defluviimonas aestuarii]|uniref:hypothetical protein n=1 Tax=Albidovulum aestuarii TaxID=1130726 RepID=UPI00249A84E4|nr:hypothetical protein [Defluviimonas aestuarii]MDI3338726.1 hypothetical protein [Defluviimonas aestuarii]